MDKNFKQYKEGSIWKVDGDVHLITKVKENCIEDNEGSLQIEGKRASNVKLLFDLVLVNLKTGVTFDCYGRVGKEIPGKYIGHISEYDINKLILDKHTEREIKVSEALDNYDKEKKSLLDILGGIGHETVDIGNGREVNKNLRNFILWELELEEDSGEALNELNDIEIMEYSQEMIGKHIDKQFVKDYLFKDEQERPNYVREVIKICSMYAKSIQKLIDISV